jgi:hypothetical protein
MSGWGAHSRSISPSNRPAPRFRMPILPGFTSFWVVLAILAAFHGTFIFMLERAVATNWLDSPAAVILAVVHICLGSIVSVWLARVLPRVLSAPAETRWISVMTASFLLTVVTSAWLGRAAFGMIPTQWIGLDFGFVGLFLAIPCSIFFWQLGKTFSW